MSGSEMTIATEGHAPPARPARPGGAGGRRGGAPRLPARLRRLGLPYLLLLPAVLLELLVHLVPMLIGIMMSFKELTQFYIRDWGSAPGAGWRTTASRSTSTRPSARTCSTPSSSPAPSASWRSACAGSSGPRPRSSCRRTSGAAACCAPSSSPRTRCPSTPR
ncbi:hypothetical protein [Thermocatellispora tengchongensis]|uniref:hypothetical protein n=1 Tax=Thermocatellispora tengchongensis TaxID=1073253 RepID=UPI00362B21DB